MTFSYKLAEGLPGDRDKVRFLSGDTNKDDHVLEDEEIDFILTQEPNIWFAAAMAVNQMVLKLQAGIWEEQKVGETRLRARRISDLKVKEDQLRARGAMHQQPSIGGVYKSERDALLSNSNILRGDFFRGMHDYPGTTRRSRPAVDFTVI